MSDCPMTVHNAPGHGANCPGGVEADPIFGEIIHSYSRAEAIEDGVLVDLMQGEFASLVRQAGFKFPIAVTAAVFERYIELTPAAKRACNDVNGRLWDILWMLKAAIRGASGQTSELLFELRCISESMRPSRVTLKSVCGPDDNGDPCITIMLRDED
jgi:hypothetical protein